MINVRLTTAECDVVVRALGFRANTDDRDMAMDIRRRIQALEEMNNSAGQRRMIVRPVRRKLSNHPSAMNAYALTCGHVVASEDRVLMFCPVCTALTEDAFQRLRYAFRNTPSAYEQVEMGELFPRIGSEK